MASYSSDSDRDDALDEDLAALRRACLLAGTDPDAAVAGISAPAVSASASDDSDSDSGEDLALLRHLREHFLPAPASSSSAAASPSSPPFAQPLCAWPPSDSDEEDDLETLRAIQRRFSHYESGTSTMSPKNEKTEASNGEPLESLAMGAHGGEIEVNKQNAKALTRNEFPKSAQLLVDALKKNRSCQKFIRRKMIEIEAKIEENKDLKERVKCLVDFQLGCKKALGKFLCQKEDPRVRLVSTRKQRVQFGENPYRKTPALSLGPDENPQVPKYKMVLKQFPMSLQKQPWSDVEKDKLAKGIKQQYQETLILNSMNNESDFDNLNAVDMASALTNTGDFEVTPESFRSFLPLMNWDKIAAMYLPGRSGAECESRWLNCDDPLINHSSWTAQEEKKLLLTVQEGGIYNWINIAVALGTHRTPFQCLARYQRSLNPHILNKDWTKEEDIQLQTAVETFGENWQLVSASLEGRTGSQCSNRWRKSLDPERKRVGRWFVDEDKRLKVAVMLFGPKNWNKIAQFIPGRTQAQCRERWVNCLSPSLNLQPWTAEEDSKLLAAIREHGYCWSKIAACMIPPRTDNQCMRRWKNLCKDEVPLVQAARKMKKNVLISNFVDRERERPGIGPSDFISLGHSEGDGGVVSTSSDQMKKPKARSRISRKENSSADDAMKSSACMNSADSDAVCGSGVVNATRGRSRRKSSGNSSRKPIEDNLAVSNNVKKSSGGNEGVKKRMRGSISVDKEGVIRRMRGSISVDEEGVIRRMRGSISGDIEGVIRRMRGSISVDNEGVKRKRKRASSKSLEDNSTADVVVNASADLGSPSMPSEGRDADVENVNKRKQKSSSRSKRGKTTAEGVVSSADTDSTGMRLAKCKSCVPENGTNRNKGDSSSSGKCSSKTDVNSIGSPGENPQVSSMLISAGPDPTSVENDSIAKTDGDI